jgi:hypothetical protein
MCAGRVAAIYWCMLLVPKEARCCDVAAAEQAVALLARRRGLLQLICLNVQQQQWSSRSATAEVAPACMWVWSTCYVCGMNFSSFGQNTTCVSLGSLT